MKFAKELEDDLVPEWRIKYFDYKQGKKKIKAITRSLRDINRTPNAPGRPNAQTADSSDQLPFTHYDFERRNERPDAHNGTATPKPDNGRSSERPAPQMRRESLTMFSKSPPVLMPASEPQSQEPSRPQSSSGSEDERRPLQPGQNTKDGKQLRRYGSIVGSPAPSEDGEHLPDLELPDPALDLSKKRIEAVNGERQSTVSKPISTSPGHTDGQRETPKKLSSLPKHMLRKRQKSHINTTLKRIFKSRPLDSPNVPSIELEPYRELDARQDEYFSFLDKEYDKIEKFYKSKEEEANDRLHALREQLHKMRDHRLKDMQTAKHGGKIADGGMLDGQLAIMSTPHKHNESHSNGHATKILDPVKDIVQQRSKIGKTSQAMKELSSPQGPQGKQKTGGPSDDYVRKTTDDEHVPYRFAKGRLKLALQEFYRGLELLKSYALLNRTAFRKINKKYDKAVNARPTLQYMATKVNHAHFVKSTVIEGHLVAIEDLYARYFERGNHKVAVSRLRSKLRQGDQSATAFRNGLYVAAGSCFGVAGIVNGTRFLFSDDPVLKTQTSYILQLYGGYFLALLLFLLFVLDCRIWQRARVNYAFVFEFDTRHVLDFRQLAEIPCFFLFLNGLFVWLNFEFSEGHTMYLYWPVVLFGLTFLIIAFPFKVFHYHSRKWFGYSNWRLLLAGLYPVEFRDFFMGDMYCSETYTLSQMEIFFCIYAHGWKNPAQCNSNHSMLLGFFTTLPAIWRALQCLRRYYDTRDWFPHLANFTKYLFNIIYYMTLSLYRLNINSERRAVFIAFAFVNGVYSSLWDIFMDWSLGNPWAPHPFLRNNLAYRRVWVYYFAMLADVVLRQQWILYAIFTEDLQHSAAMSFFVGLAEVLRRGMWSIFRVENEHCNNVVKFRASRDVPLPYALPSADYNRHKDRDESDDDDHDHLTSPATADAPGSGTGTAVDLERARTGASTGTGSSSMRQRRGTMASTPGMAALKRVGTVIAAAHSQDFQKKKRPEVVGRTEHDEKPKSSKHDSSDDNDDDDEDDDEDGDETQTVFSDIDSIARNRTTHRSSDRQHGNGKPAERNIGAGLNAEQTVSTDPSNTATSSKTKNATPSQDNEIDSEDDDDSYSDLSPMSEVPSDRRPRFNIQDDEDGPDVGSSEADIAEVRDRVDRARSPA